MKLVRRFSVIAVTLLFALLLVACNDEANTYTVNFYVNNEVIATEVTNDDGKVSFPSEASVARDGYNFTGWYDNLNGEGTKFTEEHVFDADTKLYANYEKIELEEYTLTFKADDEVIDTFTFTNIDFEFEEPEVPEKEGYVGKWEDYTIELKNLVVEAEYSLITYKATFKDENDKIVEVVDFTIEDDSLEEPVVPEKEGYLGKWEDYVIGANDLEIKLTYEIITYTASFVSGLELDVVNNVEFTIETINNIVSPSYIVRVPGHKAKWEDYTAELKDFTVKAEYTEIDNYVEVYEDAEYFDMQDIINQIGRENLQSYNGASGMGNLVPVEGKNANTLFANGEIEIVTSAERFWQFERVDGNATNYKYDGYTFTGMLKFGGVTSTEGRYIKLTPSVGATFSMWVVNPGAVPEHELYLLSELRNPIKEDGTLDESIIVEKHKTTSTISGLQPIEFNLIGGQTYYIWNPQNQPGYEGVGANKFIRGFKYNREPKDIEVFDIRVDLEDAIKEFPVNSEFTHDGIKVFVKDINDKEYEVTNFTVTADTSTVGITTAIVKYGKSLEIAYEIEILEELFYTASFYDGSDKVAEVVFSSTDTELDFIPEVPTKDGYTSRWEDFTLPASEDLTINVIYTAIDYTASFKVDGVTIGTVTFGADHPTNIDRIPTPKVPFKQGFIGKWEDYEFENVFHDLEINAVYTNNSNQYVIRPDFDPILIDGRKLRDKAGMTGNSGNIQTDPNPDTGLRHSLFFGENNEFEFGINRAIQFDRADTLYSREQEEFYGRIKTGGATHMNDRWIKISPVADARLSLFGLSVASSASPANIWLISELKDPTTNPDVIIRTEQSTTSLRNRFYDLEGGKDYYLWFEANQYISGIRLVYEDIVHEIDSLIVDTNNVKTTFSLNEEFNYDNLLVKVLTDLEETYELTNEEFVVIAPDMTSAGEKDVVVKYGEDRTVTYKITVQ